ncbi:MAG: hypothetical protein JJE25_02030, partial [Bacteroidia bacterium]|nr:hypothetical protein [Bacteroidia bacterium]
MFHLFTQKAISKLPISLLSSEDGFPKKEIRLPTLDDGLQKNAMRLPALDNSLQKNAMHLPTLDDGLQKNAMCLPALDDGLQKNTIHFLKILFALIFVSLSLALNAQCLTYPVSVPDRVNFSSVVVEGKVISQNSFWNSSHDFIYTSSQIELYKIFKGTVSATQIEIISEGGTV